MIIKNNFINKITQNFPERSTRILEIGCGYGFFTSAIARKLPKVKFTAIDIDEEKISLAHQINSSINIHYCVESAEKLSAKSKSFDCVLFSLTFHHIKHKNSALHEALRVLKKGGLLVVIEPSFDGSMFEAEHYFDCFDGDERKQKALAYYTLLNFHGVNEIKEFKGTTEWKFKNNQDFIVVMHPKNNLDEIPSFLKKHKNILSAERRINIFQKI